MAWLSGWSYRKTVSITGQTGAGTDYQVDFSIGAGSGGDFNLESHCTSFPNDIQVTDNDQTTTRDYWVEDLTVDPITMWTEVADDLGSNVDVCVYYGKSGESSASNGDNTFVFFDDFSGTLSAWTDNSQSGTNQIESGELSMDRGADNLMTKMTVTTPQCTMPFAVDFDEYEVGYYTDTGNWMGISICFPSTNDWITAVGHSFFLQHTADYTLFVDGDAKLSNASGITPTTKHKVTFRAIDGHLWSDLDNVNKVDWTGTTTRTSGYVGIRNWGFHHHIDNFRIRKYVSPAPAFASAGSEESAAAATIPVFMHSYRTLRET